MKKETANRLSAILIILLTTLVLISSFLPIFQINLSSADILFADEYNNKNDTIQIYNFYTFEDGYILKTDSLMIGCEENVHGSLLKLKPLITDFSRVSVTIRLLIVDMQISATEKNLGELAVRLLKNETDLLKKEYAELSEKLEEQKEKRDAIISSMSEEEYKELCLTLADKESELSQFIMMCYASIVASILPLGNAGTNGAAATLYVYLMLAFIVFFVVLLVMTLVRAVIFAFYTIKGIVTLLKGMKGGSADMIKALFPRKIKTFVNITILDALLFSILGVAFGRGAGAFILPISLLLISLACSIAQKERITRMNAVKKIIPIISAVLLLAIILIGFAPIKDFDAFIADKGLENDTDSGFAYMKSLAITLFLKLVIIVGCFGSFQSYCKQIRGEDEQREIAVSEKANLIGTAIGWGITIILAFVSMFFLSFEVTALIVFLIAAALNITALLLTKKNTAQEDTPNTEL